VQLKFVLILSPGPQCLLADGLISLASLGFEPRLARDRIYTTTTTTQPISQQALRPRVRSRGRAHD